MWYNHVLLFNIQGATTLQGLSRANQGQSFSFFWFLSYISKESKSYNTSEKEFLQKFVIIRVDGILESIYNINVQLLYCTMIPVTSKRYSGPFKQRAYLNKLNENIKSSHIKLQMHSLVLTFFRCMKCKTAIQVKGQVTPSSWFTNVLRSQSKTICMF